jgi:hypothetical protein
MPVQYLTPAIEDRAAEVLSLLADHGQHPPSIPDLIIAAAVPRSCRTVAFAQVGVLPARVCEIADDSLPRCRCQETESRKIG